jgi:hypothetical protein
MIATPFSTASTSYSYIVGADGTAYLFALAAYGGYRPYLSHAKVLPGLSRASTGASLTLGALRLTNI